MTDALPKRAPVARRHRFCLGLTALAALLTPLLSAASGTSEQLERALDVLADYHYGDSESWRPFLLDVLHGVADQPGELEATEATMLAFLESDASAAGRKTLARTFAWIATKRSEDAIVKLARRHDFEASALQILGFSGLGSADDLLAIGQDATDAGRMRIADLLGERREFGVVSDLAEWLKRGPEPVASAVVNALGKIGTRDAAGVLEKTVRNPGLLDRTSVERALLACAERLAADGKRDAARDVYARLYKASEDPLVRIAALNGRFRVARDPAAFVVRAVAEAEPAMREHAIRLVYDLPSRVEVADALFGVRGLSSADTVQLIEILAARGDHSAAPHLSRFLHSDDAAIRLAAIRAYPRIGMAGDVPIVLEFAVSGETSVRRAARDALAAIPGRGIDETLMRMLSSASPEEQVVLADVVTARDLTDATASLLSLARSGNEDVRAEAVRALGRTAPLEMVPAMVRLLEEWSGSDAGDSRALARAIQLVVIRQPDQDQGIAVLESEAAKTENPAFRETIEGMIESLRRRRW